MRCKMVRNFAVRSRRKGLGAASLGYGFLRYVAFLTGWSARTSSSQPGERCFGTESAASSAEKHDVDDMNRLLDIDINDPLAVPIGQCWK